MSRPLSKWNENITRNSSRWNNHDDFLHLSFTLKISVFPYFQRTIYNLAKHLWWRFCNENSKPLNLFIKISIIDARLGSKSASAFTRRDFLLNMLLNLLTYLAQFYWLSQKRFSTTYLWASFNKSNLEQSYTFSK